jgi:inner membrane protein
MGCRPGPQTGDGLSSIAISKPHQHSSSPGLPSVRRNRDGQDYSNVDSLRMRERDMASIISHAAAGAALSIAIAPNHAPERTWPVAIAAAVLPDADSLLHYFGVSYSPVLSHRGFFHSPFLGLIISFLLMLLFFRGEALFSGRWFRYFLVFFLAWSSHGFLDGLTNGGRGVAFLSPLSSKRYFLPWTPIQVSPMRIQSFFTARGWAVFKNELVWIWLPGLALVLLSRAVRLWKKKCVD